MAVGIVVAMQEEAIPLINAVGAKPKGILGKRNIFTTKYRNEGIEDTLVFEICGVGRSNAARATAGLIDLGCRAIMNVGTCGCTYKDEVTMQGRKFIPQVGEVWVPSVILDGEYDVSALSGKIEHDPVHLFQNVTPVAGPGEIRLYTVNHFSETPIDEGNYLVDMEAYDVLSICDGLSTPCRIVKVISDCANSDASKDFDANLRYACDVSVKQVLVELDCFLKILWGMDNKGKKLGRVEAKAS